MKKKTKENHGKKQGKTSKDKTNTEKQGKKRKYTKEK